ncbi:MAG: LysR substrate-binding domain-containing protein [Ignavibacteriota bacterium]
MLHRKEQFELALERMKSEVESARPGGVHLFGWAVRDGTTAGGIRHPPIPTRDCRWSTCGRIAFTRRFAKAPADLGLVSYPEESREITAMHWRNEEMQLAVPPSHPLASCDEVYPADLNGQDFVGFDEDLSHPQGA